MDIAAAKKRCEAIRKSHREIKGVGQPDCTGCNQIWPCHARTLADILAAALEALEEAQGKLERVQSAYDNFECRRFDAMTAIKEVGAALAATPELTNG